LSLDPLEENKVDFIGGEVDYSSCGGAHKPKQRNRETKMVLSIVEQASVSYGRETRMVFLFLLISLVLAQGAGHHRPTTRPNPPGWSTT